MSFLAKEDLHVPLTWTIDPRKPVCLDPTLLFLKPLSFFPFILFSYFILFSKHFSSIFSKKRKKKQRRKKKGKKISKKEKNKKREIKKIQSLCYFTLFSIFYFMFSILILIFWFIVLCFVLWILFSILVKDLKK